jgi:hypothetical protein
MNYLKISFGIFLALAASRFIPHPPNFTTLLALAFYIPVFFGYRFIPVLVISFLITDFFIGFHGATLFTWGSVIMIGLISKYFNKSISTRIPGALFGATIFFIVTNFGVWSLGSYGYTFNGLLACYTLAIPFFAYSLISTFICSGIIETVYKFHGKKIKTII